MYVSTAHGTLLTFDDAQTLKHVGLAQVDDLQAIELNEDDLGPKLLSH